MLFIVLGILGGASIVLSRMCNADLAARVGVWRSTRMNYITGLSVALLAMLVIRLLWPAPLPAFTAPRTPMEVLMYVGGALGVATVAISNLITLRMSALVMTLLIFLSQLGCGILLDYMKTRVLPPGQLVGGALLLVGLFLYQSPAKKRADEG